MNNAEFIAPKPDKDIMLLAMSAMFDPTNVVELRAVYKGKKRTDAGYFDGEHWQELANEAARMNVAGAAVYVNLNQIDAQLLGRYCNRVEQFAAATATDANVIRRKWLLLDFDPVRPKDTSATDVQLEAAHQKARECAKCLKDAAWPDPLAGQSGNGWHLLYPLDLPNDTESRDLVKGALTGLAAQFDDAVVTVDQTVFNAGRITKLFGTVANKGDHTSLSPWRLSRLVSNPVRGGVVTVDQLRALHPKAATSQPASSGRSDFNLSDFLNRLGIPYAQDQHEGRERYKLANCPFNTDHGTGEAAIFRAADGRLGFKCQHNSCADKGWQDVRALLDGPREGREQRRTGADGHARAEYQPGNKSTPAGDPAGRAWPDPLADEAFFGLAGEIVRTIEPQTESDPAAILLQVLVAFGSLVGRGPHFPIEGDQHHSNLFTLIVGETSKARKGTSWGRVREIFSRAAEWPNVVDGLSTGEGLKYAVRDRVTKIERDDKGFAKQVETDPGVTDKRLLVVEAEFAQVLKQAPRAGNTLSATIRSAWDSGNLRTLTKNDPITATGAHICIVGHITSNELRAELTATDSANGFANRFLFMAVKRSKALAFGGQPLAPDVVADFAKRIAEAAGEARQLGAVSMTASARAAWSAAYERLSEGYPGLYGAVTARAEAQCLRLALTYALMCGEQAPAGGFGGLGACGSIGALYLW
jgi:hypothetical protein